MCIYMVSTLREYIGLSFFFLTVYFEIIIDSQEVVKMWREVPCIFHPVCPNDNILYKYSIISKPGNWHWYNPQFIHISPATHASVCMCVYSCAIS